MRILLATDGSAHARIAEVLVDKLFSKDAEVVVATAALPPAMVIPGAFPPAGGLILAEQATEVFDHIQRVAQRTCEGVADRLRAKGFAAHPVVLEGDAGNTLLEYSEAEQIDLIAMGSRGHGGLKGLLLGSVARKLVNHSKVSVLIGRTYEEVEAEETVTRLADLPKLSAVLAYDGSDGAKVALEWIKSRGAGAFRKLIAACADPLAPLPLEIDPSEYQGIQGGNYHAQAATREARTALEGFADEVGSDVQLGRPAEFVALSAKKHDADLVVVGANQHGMWERFLAGSVSFEISTSAPCSVLVVRPQQ